ncbi:MAG: 1-acyl-sn-glycerol-3-phosphate acyltransferase [Xanthomonadaceae bacterium]|nr:1-acyl-sn-glycerol-3-phosphate acyltransferase [Xanthomonadaceae bacterium]
MTTTPPTVAFLPRAFRYLWRGPLLLWHACIDLPIVLLLIALGRGGALSHGAIRWFAGSLLWIFGLRLRREGTPLPGGTLFVANHVSWIDIMVLHSQHMMGFIAKSEIRGWPLIGWVVAQAETIFLQRGNGDSLGLVMAEMAQRLRDGRAVAAFPEGGTRNGRALGTFHARIFTAAVEAQAPVQPVALCYGVRSQAQPIVAFAPRESFAGNLLRLLGEPARPVRVCFLAPIHPDEHDGRRGMAQSARARIEQAMAQD